MYTAVQSFKGNFPKEIFDDTKDVIEKITALGIKIGILTSSRTEQVIEDLNRLGIPPKRFFHIQGSDQTRVGKPNPGVFEPIMKKINDMGVDKGSVAYVGDSLIDLKTATDAKLDFIAVATGTASREELQNQGAKTIASSLSEILEFI
jgi:phosphoglycolate phosphatase